MKRFTLLIFSALLTGCGSVMSPFLIRLDADQQKAVDGMWNNMFTPPARLDRELLLDVLCEYQVLQFGADRMHITAEKYLASGNVFLEADFDRANPEADQMTVMVVDAAGRTVRRERYSRREINARLPEMTNAMNGTKLIDGAILVNAAATQPATPETPDARQLRLEREAHMARLAAATQPVGKR